MAALEFFVIAGGVSIDQQSNRVSVFDIIEQVQVRELPGVMHEMVAVALFLMEDDDVGEEFQAALRFCPPNGEPMPEARLNFSARSRRHRITLRLQAFAFTQVGPWRVELTMNDEHYATHTIEVLQRNEPGGGAPTPPS